MRKGLFFASLISIFVVLISLLIFEVLEKISRDRLIAEIINIIQKNTYYYPLTPEEISGLKQCMKISSEEDFVHGCFTIDSHGQYISPERLKSAVEGKNNLHSRIIDRSIGYIRIPSFNPENVGEEFTSILESFNKRGIKKIILDLSGNGGGRIIHIANVTFPFAPKPFTVVFEWSLRSGRERSAFLAFKKGEYAFWNIAVLVDKKTASASEAVAGVLQVWGAYVIGLRTDGKGMVGDLFNLSNGGILFISTHEYHVPKKILVPMKDTPLLTEEEAGKLVKKVEGEGIIPDEIIDDPEARLERAADYLKNLK